MEKVVTGFAWHITVSLDSHCPLGQKASKKTAKNLSPEQKAKRGIEPRNERQKESLRGESNL